MKRSQIPLIAVALWLTIGVKPALAAPDEYDDSQSHPFRVAAYLLHPIGWLTEWIMFRPFHYLVSATAPQEAFFGHYPHPPVLGEPQPLQDYGVAKKVPLARIASQPPSPAPVLPPETVKIVEVPVEKVVVREVPKTVTVEVERVVFSPVAFAFDHANLTDLGKGQVYLTAQRLKEKADLTIAIEGHTDNQGSDDYNQKLGMQRAQTVMNELVAQGIDRNRISAVSVGEAKPAIGQETTWARAVNRRVEFQVKATQ